MDDELREETRDECCEERPSLGHNLPGAAQIGGSVLSRDDGDCCEAAVPAARMHKISIHPLDFGWNVKIGCQDFAVETSEKLIKNLEAYLNDPQGTEKKWLKDKKLL